MRRMKLRLAQYVLSQAKHLLRSEVKAFDQVGALIRRRAVRAAERCSRLGRNNDIQLHKSLKEFLAFFCVVAVNELGIRLGTRSDEELKNVYGKLVKSVCEGTEPDEGLLPHRVTVNGLITYKKSGFDHWFYGYWNADLEGMRITKDDLKQIEQRQIQGPTGDYCGDASFILLVRVARLENTQSAIPSAPVMIQYDTAIRDEVDAFVRELKQILKD